MIYILIALFAILTVLILNFRDFFSKKIGMYDQPNARKIHKVKKSNIGGLSILLPTFVSILLINVIDEQVSIRYSVTLILLTIAFFLLGFFDDKKQMKPNSKILFLIIFFFSFIPFYGNFIIHDIRFPTLGGKMLSLNFFGIFFTFFCFFIFFNTLNFVDGVNGLLSSISIYWLIVIIFLFGNYNLISLTLLTSLIVFFFYNINDKVFLGNSGANTLAILISLLTIDIYNKSSLIGAEEIFFLFLFPGLDSLRVIIERLIKSKNIFLPDNTHLHHMMIKKIKTKYIWFCYLLLTVSIFAIFKFTNNTYLTFIISLIIYFRTYFILKKIK